MSETKILSRLFDLKSNTVDMEARTFEGLSNTWQLDFGGDVIDPGSFKRTLDHWRESGRVVPLLDQHKAWDSVTDVVGKLVEARETDEGLWTKFEMVADPKGDAVLTRLRGGFVDGLSIGYRPIKVEQPTDDERRAGMLRRIKEVELKEVSVVVFPMNDGSRVKSEDREEDGTDASASSGNGLDDGLAPDDPKRLAIEARLRAVKIQRLAGRGTRTS